MVPHFIFEHNQNFNPLLNKRHTSRVSVMRIYPQNKKNAKKPNSPGAFFALHQPDYTMTKPGVLELNAKMIYA
jgi:hypothetical protein